MKLKEHQIWQKINQYGRQAGIKVIYAVLLMYYAFRRKDTPRWAKSIIVGVLGYFLAPIDGIPDLTPILGYTDDLGVLLFGLVSVAAYINPEVREQAREKLKNWFGEYDAAPLLEVDKKL